MHPKVEEAFQQIDAALFNGDTFDSPEDKKHLHDYLLRWLKESKLDLEPFFKDDEVPDTPKEPPAYLALARRHIEGHDREKDDDDYPECWKCNELMERGDSEPCAFCATCIYEVADVLAEGIESLDTALVLTKNSRNWNFTKRLELEQKLKDFSSSHKHA